MSNRTLKSAVRRALAAGALATAFAAPPVLAQTDTEAADLERVQVTGSRILRTDIEGASPVLRFDREELQATGVNSVQDFIRQLTIATTQNFDTFTNSFANSTAGINLRGLGNQATLVLVNGRRVAPYGRGQNIREGFVDLNSIPFQAIDRIEVLKDGASAIYGSDAIAGVVNIIMRDDYEGAEIQVDYQNTARGDSEEFSASAIFGTRSADTSITFNMAYFSREALFLRDRSFSNFADRREFGGFNELSAFAFPGTIYDPVSGQYSLGGECDGVVPVSGGALGERCTYNYSKDINFFPEYESFSANAFVNHDLSADHTLFSEFSYTRRASTNIAAPAPFVSHTTLSRQLLAEAGYVTDAEVTALRGPLGLPAFSGLLFSAENPYNTFGNDVGLVYRPVPAGPRTEETTSDTFRVLTGVEGTLADFWNYEGVVHYARNQVSTQNQNSVLARDLQGLLMGAITGADGNPLWLNPFGENPDEVVNRLSTMVSAQDYTVDQGVSFQVTGPVLEMPAGDLGFAAGVEYREARLSNEASPDRNRGELVGTGSSDNSFGERDITTVFAELSIPLLDTLEMQLAARWEDYSDFGTNTSPKIGLRFQPMADLLLRASWGESFRAPSLFELFQGSVTSFPSFIDPIRCPDGPDGTNFPSTTSIDCGGGQFRQESGGNPFLQPETSDSYNVGFVWNPDFVRGLTVAGDFWRYETEDIITGVPLSLLLAINDPTIIVRGAPSAADLAAGLPADGGPITFVNNSFINANKQKTQGFDLDVTYRWDTAARGRWLVGFQGTYYDKFELSRLVLQDGEPTLITDDFIGNTLQGTRPDYILRGNVRWNMGRHMVNLVVNHRDGVESSLGDLRTGGPATADPYFISSFTTTDIQYGFDLNARTTLSVGCLNCFDYNPPNDNDNFAGFLADADDPRGVRLYGRVNYQF